MATSKKPSKASSTVGAAAKSKTAGSLRARAGTQSVLQSNDVGVEQGGAVNDLAAAIPYNPTKIRDRHNHC